MLHLNIVTAILILSFSITDFNMSSESVCIIPPPGVEYDSLHSAWILTGRPFIRLTSLSGLWDDCRDYVDYVAYYEWLLNPFSDSTLRSAFNVLHTLELPLGLETGVLKTDLWYTGEQAYSVNSPLWSRFDSLGANVKVLLIDESFYHGCQPGMGGDSFAVQETADWIELVRTNFDDMIIGSIEPFTSFSSSQIIWWIDQLNTECAARSIDGIQLFSLDPNWVEFTSEDWEEILVIESYCDSIDLPFSMKYWPSLHPNTWDDDEDFYHDIMYQGYVYDSIGGSPDEYVIQSWSYIPQQIVGEEDEYSFTYACLQFFEEYLPNVEVLEYANIANSVRTMSDTEVNNIEIIQTTRNEYIITIDDEYASLYATLAIYDIYGRQIICLYSGSFQHMKSEYSVNMNGLSNGVYFVVLSTEDSIQCEKLISI